MPVIVKTDYNNLKEFIGKEKLNSRQIYWIQKLTEYNFRIKYWSGKSNPTDSLLWYLDYKSLKDEVAKELLLDIQAKLRGIFMIYYTVFLLEECKWFTIIVIEENSLENRPL